MGTAIAKYSPLPFDYPGRAQYIELSALGDIGARGGVITITVTGTSLSITELPTSSPVKINLDKEKYAAMIKDIKFNGNSTDSSCAICQEDFKNKEDLKITPCEHIFHPKCISTWLKKECTRPTCPSCRHDCREELNNDSKPR